MEGCSVRYFRPRSAQKEWSRVVNRVNDDVARQLLFLFIVLTAKHVFPLRTDKKQTSKHKIKTQIGAPRSGHPTCSPEPGPGRKRGATGRPREVYRCGPPCTLCGHRPFFTPGTKGTDGDGTRLERLVESTSLSLVLSKTILRTPLTRLASLNGPWSTSGFWNGRLEKGRPDRRRGQGREGEVVGAVPVLPKRRYGRSSTVTDVTQGRNLGVSTRLTYLFTYVLTRCLLRWISKSVRPSLPRLTH